MKLARSIAPMLSALLVVGLSVALALTLAACDDAFLQAPSHESANELAHPGAGVAESGGTARLALSENRASAIRSAADAAFARLEGRSARHESRVGPQPWPSDLPGRWPVLPDATVVADTRRSEGDRLLLINVPGSAEQAIRLYESVLIDRGYRVDRPPLRRERRALHAQGADHEAVVTFSARERTTRVEILFLAPVTG